MREEEKRRGGASSSASSQWLQLPRELWAKVVEEGLGGRELFAFASTCRLFRSIQAALRESGRGPPGLRTSLGGRLRQQGMDEGEGRALARSAGWIRWVVSRRVAGGSGLAGCPWGKHLCNEAAWGGHLEALQWLRENKCRWNAVEAAHHAAEAGHVHVLEWMLREASARGAPAPLDEKTCAFAAWGGQLATLQWLRRRGTPWKRWTCSYAAARGQLEVLQWARAEGCEWNGRTTSRAALGGHLEVLRWCRDNGAPFSAKTCSEAARGGHAHCLRWLRSWNCPWDAWTQKAAKERLGYTE